MTTSKKLVTVTTRSRLTLRPTADRGFVDAVAEVGTAVTGSVLGPSRKCQFEA